LKPTLAHGLGLDVVELILIGEVFGSLLGSGLLFGCGVSKVLGESLALEQISHPIASPRTVLEHRGKGFGASDEAKIAREIETWVAVDVRDGFEVIRLELAVMQLEYHGFHEHTLLGDGVTCAGAREPPMCMEAACPPLTCPHHAQ